MRKLRIIPKAGTAQESEFDKISNPSLLAHHLFSFNQVQDTIQYNCAIRMSSLATVCVRERVIGALGGLSFNRKNPVGLQVTYDIGHAVHNFFQTNKKYAVGKRLGWWKCNYCGYKYFGRMPKGSCPVCQASPKCIKHREHHLDLHDPYYVTGHTDDFFEVDLGDIRVTDYKTLSSDEFKKLTAPKGEHLIQVVGYMMCCQHDQTLPVRVNPERGLLVYISKGHCSDQLPMKVFHVQKTPFLENYVHTTLSSFKNAIDARALPEPKQECVSSGFGGTKAKNCPLKKECQQFYTGEKEWMW